MNISELVKKAHKAAIEKGFYDCPECKGNELIKDENNNHTGLIICSKCNGLGINPNRNISELLMLIVSEIGEAQEALRKNKHGDIQSFEDSKWPIDIPTKDYHEYEIYSFEEIIKDTFEDEIADTFIRLFDLCGYLNIDIIKHIEAKMKYNESRPQKYGKEF